MGTDKRMISKAVLGLTRLLGASVVLSVGSVLIYGFGAGYLAGYGLWVPTPWNFVLTILLAIVLLLAVVRILGFPRKAGIQARRRCKFRKRTRVAPERG